MNLDKTASALKRINRLYELISEMGEASTTEQDLLKAYVMDLYKAVADGEELPVADSPTANTTTPKRTAVPTPPPVAQPTAQPAPKASPVSEEVIPEPAVEQAAPQPQKKVTAAANSELDELFQTEKISELSDKLSCSPISDLTKAMGLNEKIFTVNELFEGNNGEFQNLMVALNGLNSYDEAKTVLMSSVATKYEWSKPDKLKKARNFIKLIQRRYN